MFQILLSDAIDDFEEDLKFNGKSDWTRDGYIREMRSVKDYLEKEYNGPVYVEDISRSDLKGYLKHIEGKGYQPSSRNRVMFILRSFYNFAVKENIVEENLAQTFEKVSERTKERVYLNDDEMEELMAEIDHNVVKAAAYTIYYSGLRVSECLSLTFDDIDFDRDIIYVRQGKGNKDRNVPINSKLKDILTDFIQNKRKSISSKKVFATEISGSLSNAYFNRKIRDAVEKLGWKKEVSAHTFRHSFASNLVKKDINIYKIKKLLGHSNIQVTSIYTHSNIEDLSAAVSVL